MRCVPDKCVWWILCGQLLVLGHLQRAWTLRWCRICMRVCGGMVGIELLCCLSDWCGVCERIYDMVWCWDVSKWVRNAGHVQLHVVQRWHILDWGRSFSIWGVRAVWDGYISVAAGRDEHELVHTL